MTEAPIVDAVEDAAQVVTDEMLGRIDYGTVPSAFRAELRGFVREYGRFLVGLPFDQVRSWLESGDPYETQVELYRALSAPERLEVTRYALTQLRETRSRRIRAWALLSAIVSAISSTAAGLLTTLIIGTLRDASETGEGS